MRRRTDEPARVLHSDVLDRLGMEIAGGGRRPGDVLTLAELEAAAGVSRTVAREAVRILESMGMVASRRRVGVVVRPRERWNALDPRLIRWRLAGPGRDDQLRSLTELRMAVEPIAARLAARHASQADVARLHELAATLRTLGQHERGDSAEYLMADVEFHRLVLRASGNEMLAALGPAIAAVLAGRTALGLTPARPVPPTLDHHEAVAAAVGLADEDAAERHARAVTEEVWREVVAQARGDDGGRATRSAS